MINDKELAKDFIFTKWAEYGFTPNDVKHMFSTIKMMKKADTSSTNAMWSTIPLALFSIPMVGGALYYDLTTPNITQKAKLRTAREKMFKQELENINQIRSTYMINEPESSTAELEEEDEDD